MTQDDRLRTLTRQERIELCQQVMENLSDLVEGTASRELCQRIDSILGGCQPYTAYRNTLQATIRMLNRCGSEDPALSTMDDECFQRAVRRARAALESPEE